MTLGSRFRWRRIALSVTVCLAFLLAGFQVSPATPVVSASPDAIYQQRSPSRDGIGKVYMGREIAQAIAQALKPNGRVVLVEYRGENPLIPIKALHKMTQQQVRNEMSAVGLTWLETKETLPQQHILFFGKKT